MRKKHYFLYLQTFLQILDYPGRDSAIRATIEAWTVVPAVPAMGLFPFFLWIIDLIIISLFIHLLGYKILHLSQASGAPNLVDVSNTITLTQFQNRLPYDVDIDIKYYIPFTSPDEGDEDQVEPHMGKQPNCRSGENEKNQTIFHWLYTFFSNPHMKKWSQQEEQEEEEEHLLRRWYLETI